MLFAAIAALIGSAACAYLIGYTFAAPRDAFVRTKRGMLLVIVVGLSVIPLPPQLPSLAGAVGSLGGAAASLGGLAWPESLSKGVYLALWALTSVAGFLVGIRIWQLGTPEWRGGAGRAVDSSAASRVTGLIPLADRIEDVLGVLSSSGLSARDVPRVAEALRIAGGRFANSLPPTDGEVYRLVSAHVPAAIAGPVTGLLLEGAGRRGSR